MKSGGNADREEEHPERREETTQTETWKHLQFREYLDQNLAPDPHTCHPSQGATWAGYLLNRGSRFL